MSLSPTDSDKKVLRAFADRKSASNNRIESTGDRLNIYASGCVARWSGDHIIDFGYESGGKFGPALIRALKKFTAPNDWAKKNKGLMRKNSQYSYKWFGIVRVGGKSKICLANEYKEDALEAKADLGIPKSLVKIVSRDAVYKMGLKPSPSGPDWARESDLREIREAMKRMKKNPTNRWGESFKKGDLVSWGGGAGGRATGRYVKLAPADDFSRAYGRQALISLGSGPMSKDPDDWTEVGLGDLKNEREARKNGSRYTTRATSGSFWAGQSERFPWRRNTRAPSKYEHEYILQGNYGYGWDDLEFQDKTSFGLRELRQLKKTYEANQRGAYRIISRKTLKGSVL